MPLMMLGPGDRAKVVEIRGGRGVRQRLSSMGIYAGEIVTLVRGGRGGPVIVEVRGTRIVIGRGMGHRVAVERLD